MLGCDPTGAPEPPAPIDSPANPGVWRHLGDHRRLLVVALGTALALQLLYVWSYVRALSERSPHHIPVAVVGTVQTDRGLLDELARLVGSHLDVRTTSTLGTARGLIEDQRIFAVIEPVGRRAVHLFVSSASGISIARLFRQSAPRVAARAKLRLEITDLKPLPPTDPQGLVSFYVILGSVIYGYVAAILSMQAAPNLMPQARLIALALFSATGGLSIALLVRVLLHALPASLAAMAVIVALAMFAAAALTALLLHVFGRFAVPLAIFVFVILGSPSSGGAVATDLLPGFFRFIGQWLPPGAGVSALRDAAYFKGPEHLRPVLVLIGWAAVASTTLAVTDYMQARAARLATLADG